MAGQADQGSGQENKRVRASAGWRNGRATMRGCPAFPTNISARTARPRAVWTRFFDAFAALAPADIERRFASADRHLREAGVTYRAPGETADRLWPLSHLPLMIDETDWQQLTAGIAQRAQLLEMVLGDLYGEGRLVAEGAMPAAAIAGSDRISALGLRRQTAGRPLSASLCRRCRPRARRALVGARRPHAGAVGRRLRAGKPPGAVARLFQSLQVDERRARRAVLRGLPRQPARQRRPRRAADRPADAGHLQRDLFRACDAGALSRLPAGRGRRSRRQRRPHPYPHRRRPEAARRVCCAGSIPIFSIRWNSMRPRISACPA